MSDAGKLSAVEAVAAVMADIGAVGKDRKTTDGPKYSYRSIDGLVNGISAAVHRHGLVIIPHVEASEVVPMAGRNGWTETRLTVAYTVCGPDGSTLPTPVQVFAVGADNSDKGAGKAMSYAYKTAMVQLLCIPTDDPSMDNEATPIPPAALPMTGPQRKRLRELSESIPEESRQSVKDEAADLFGPAKGWSEETAREAIEWYAGTAAEFVELPPTEQGSVTDG